MGVPPAAPLANKATVSLVLVSPSIEMELKDLEMACLRRGFNADGVIGASVHKTPRRVAILGWIIPAPLVIPASRYCRFGEEGSVNVLERSFGNVSVVQIDRAVVSQASCVEERLLWAVGILSRILERGSLIDICY